MCLAVPMTITEMSDDLASGVCELDGVRHDVNLSLVEDPEIGDYVIVHAGFAIEKLDQDEAASRLELFEELAETNEVR